MKTLSQFIHEYALVESTEGELLDIISKFENISYELKDESIVIIVPNKNTLESIIQTLPEDVDYELFAFSANEPEDEPEDEDEEYDEIPESSEYKLVIFTYNTDLTEAKRVKKVNAKGKVKIKMQCKKGFKWDGSSCKPIAGSDKLTKKLSVKKASKTKKAMGPGYFKKIAKKTKKAMKKRKAIFGK
jgi:hypothetical protein